jgi:AcrR family transcriptional regulator
MEKISLKEQQLRLREDLILQAVNELLAKKGYDLMTVDEVAATVGMAKPSLYKHFESKEALAAAAMVRLLERTHDVVRAQPAGAAPLDKLRAVLRWALEQHLRGTMPLLPSTRSTLREALMRNKAYVNKLMEVSEPLSEWIDSAQKAGQFAPDLPLDVALFTLFARSCDPVLDYLKLGGNYSDADIVEHMLKVTFDGLARAGTIAGKARGASVRKAA